MAKKKMSIILFSLLLFILIGAYLHKQKENRLNTKVEVICNGVHMELNAEEFKSHKENLTTEITRISQPVTDLLVNKESDSEDIEETNLLYLGEFLLTGYCDCPICQEEWVGTTALGVAPTEEWTIAVDPDIIPLGSFVWIDGHRYRAEDVGGAINDNHIDMFMPSHEDCYQDICNGYKDVYLEVE